MRILLILTWPALLWQILPAVLFAAEPATKSEATKSNSLALQRFTATEKQMGMPIRMVVYTVDEAQAKQAFQTVFKRFAELNAVFSDYTPESELLRLCAAAPTSAEGIAVSDDLFRVLVLGKQLSEQTDGAFDMTIGPLTQLWRKSKRTRRLPSDADLQAARAAVGYRHLRLNAKTQTAALDKEGMRLDAGAIAVGYAVDQSLAAITKLGITSAMIDASGDIGCTGPPPGEKGWRIGIAPLNPDAPPSRFLRLAHGAVTTSGDAYQHVTLNGTRYSHIVDQRTGLGMTRLTAATVIANNCTTADSLATALCLLGPEAGVELLKKYPGSEAVIIVGPDSAQGKNATEQTVPIAAPSPAANPPVPSPASLEPRVIVTSGVAKWEEAPTPAAQP